MVGWITRIEDRVLNIVPRDGKEPILTNFTNKQIYLPNEEEQYEAEVLAKDAVWIGVTGWTAVPKHYTQLYGTSTEQGIYETLVTALLMESALLLKQQGIAIDLRHGASDVGVDAAALRAMDEIPISGSGVNCPEFMPYVKDDQRGGPVLVAKGKEEYHERFAKYHHILLVTGGRNDAFYHDYLNRMAGAGYSVCADVMQVASDVPIAGQDTAPGEQQRMHNAAAYIREKNSFTYAPLPKSFEELTAVTKLTLLSHAYTLLGRQPDQALLASLEEEVTRNRQHGKRKPTTAELEERISAAKKMFDSL
jgi:hypothetical protein